MPYGVKHGFRPGIRVRVMQGSEWRHGVVVKATQSYVHVRWDGDDEKTKPAVLRAYMGGVVREDS